MNKFLKVFTETVEKYGKYTAHYVDNVQPNPRRVK